MHPTVAEIRSEVVDLTPETVSMIYSKLCKLMFPDSPVFPDEQQPETDGLPPAIKTFLHLKPLQRVFDLCPGDLVGCTHTRLNAHLETASRYMHHYEAIKSAEKGPVFDYIQAIEQFAATEKRYVQLCQKLPAANGSTNAAQALEAQIDTDMKDADRLADAIDQSLAEMAQKTTKLKKLEQLKLERLAALKRVQEEAREEQRQCLSVGEYFAADWNDKVMRVSEALETLEAEHDEARSKLEAAITTNDQIKSADKKLNLLQSYDGYILRAQQEIAAARLSEETVQLSAQWREDGVKLDKLINEQQQMVKIKAARLETNGDILQDLYNKRQQTEQDVQKSLKTLSTEYGKLDDRNRDLKRHFSAMENQVIDTNALFDQIYGGLNQLEDAIKDIGKILR